VKSHRDAQAQTFSDCVQEHLRSSGYTQKELADALGLHPKVLSRKLNGSGNAHLTGLEIQRIILTLAGWHTINSQDEVLFLLELAGMDDNIFSADEWRTPPLSTLTKKRAPTISSTSQPSPQHNLPAQTTRLIGREWAVERLQHLLQRDDVRIVTLVGPGGSGKTRLAQHVACELVDAFAQGAWFVALAGVSDPAQAPISISQALNIKAPPDVSPLQSLVTHLKKRQLLLLLDNFEQIAEARTGLEELLAGVPGLKVLVTSRVVLHLYGEHEFSVPPLDLPDPTIEQETGELLHYGAIQLFVKRAQAVQPDFALTNENATTIAQICARVDGLPLSLELAAARVRVLPPALLLERITQARLHVLTRGARNLPDRQQTLSNTITWSYNLLTPTEQAWFSRLGVFTGGWSLTAAEAMMSSIAANQEGTDPLTAPLDMLEQLLDNSLLVQLPLTDEEPHFTMLETLREYALAQLAARGEFERLRDWHACYYLQKAEAAELGVRGPQQLTWLARQTTESDNFRAALEWSLHRGRERMRMQAFPAQTLSAQGTRVAGSILLTRQGALDAGLPAVELALRLAAAFRPYWEWQGYLPDARNWLSAALAIPLASDDDETVIAARAKALSEYSRLISLQNDQVRAVALVEESITLWRRLDDPDGLASALLHRSYIAHAMSEYEKARDACLEALDVLTAADDPWLRGQLFCYLAAAAGFTGNFEQMHAYYAQSRALFERVGDRSSVADVLKDEGGMLILESRYSDAIDCLLESLQVCYKLDHKQFITTGLCWLSIACGMRGEPDAVSASLYAAQLEGVVAGLQETIGLNSWTKTHPFIQMVQQYIRSRVDEESWQAALNAGRALTLEQAISLAYKAGADVQA